MYVYMYMHIYVCVYRYMVWFCGVFFYKIKSTLITKPLSMKLIHISKRTAKGPRSFTGTGHV